MPADLFVSRRGRQIWAAVRENGQIVELHVDPIVGRAQVGRIVKARVSRVLPGIQSAFLDTGDERNAFLHVADLLLPEEPPPTPQAGELDDSRRAPRVASAAPIEDRLKEGRELVVQVTRDAMGTKGARLTCHLTLAGRLLVLFPRLGLRTVSRRIGDDAERARLQALLEGLAASGVPPAPAGLVARTAAAGADEASLERDARWLLERWREIDAGADRAGAPTVLHEEPELPLRLLRDAPRGGYGRVVFDDADDHTRARTYVRQVDPSLAGSVELHGGAGALFDEEGLDHELHRALRPRVWLKSGGHLVIEETEALVSIDVNTGKFVGRRHLEETLLRTNLEAAHEIVRQLRLRDLGGIVAIDFIDMESPDSRRQVTEALQTGLAADRARTQVVGISELGLLHLARRRTRPGPGRALLRDCPVCRGQGRIASADALAARALSEIRRLRADRHVRVTLAAHPDVIESLRETPGFADVELVEEPELAPDAYDLRRG